MKFLSHIPSFVRNKFFLAGAAFVVWMLFCDRNDVFTQLERKKELRAMEQSKRFYLEQISANESFSKDLQFNASAIEKYAREKYLMKRDNEDLFIIQSPEKK